MQASCSDSPMVSPTVDTVMSGYLSFNARAVAQPSGGAQVSSPSVTMITVPRRSGSDSTARSIERAIGVKPLGSIPLILSTRLAR